MCLYAPDSRGMCPGLSPNQEMYPFDRNTQEGTHDFRKLRRLGRNKIELETIFVGPTNRGLNTKSLREDIWHVCKRMLLTYRSLHILLDIIVQTTSRYEETIN